MTRYDDKLRDAIAGVGSVACDLHRLARAFRTIGNHDFADRLQEYDNQLSSAYHLLREAQDDIVSERLAEAQATTRLMLEATIAGVKVQEGRS